MNDAQSSGPPHVAFVLYVRRSLAQIDAVWFFPHTSILRMHGSLFELRPPGPSFGYGVISEHAFWLLPVSHGIGPRVIPSHSSQP